MDVRRLFDRQFNIGTLRQHGFLAAKRNVERIGLEWHSLRDTYASLMTRAGIDTQYRWAKPPSGTTVAPTSARSTSTQARRPGNRSALASRMAVGPNRVEMMRNARAYPLKEVPVCGRGGLPRLSLKPRPLKQLLSCTWN